MKPEAKQWLDQGEKNFDSAEYMWKGHRYSFTCFLCQQTLEAILKAAIIELAGKRHPKIHDLGILYKRSTLPIREDYRITLEKITPHYWEVRYPDMVRHKYNRALAEKTLKQTKEVYSWLKKQILKK